MCDNRVHGVYLCDFFFSYLSRYIFIRLPARYGCCGRRHGCSTGETKARDVFESAASRRIVGDSGTSSVRKSSFRTVRRVRHNCTSADPVAVASSSSSPPPPSQPSIFCTHEVPSRDHVRTHRTSRHFERNIFSTSHSLSHSFSHTHTLLFLFPRFPPISGCTLTSRCIHAQICIYTHVEHGKTPIVIKTRDHIVLFYFFPPTILRTSVFNYLRLLTPRTVVDEL